MPLTTRLRTALIGMGATALLCAGGWALWAPNPVAPPVAGEPVGVGALLQGPRGTGHTDSARAAARARAQADLPGAPAAIQRLAVQLFLGQPVRQADLEGIDTHLLTYVFHAPQALDTGGGSLAREAAHMGRIDALRALAEAGVSTQADDGILFWAALENWTPDTATDGRAVLARAATDGGTHRVHEDGFTAFEMAASVSLDTVLALIETGANPWTHPSDPDESLGFPSVMERLSLHAGAKGALGILEGITQAPALPVPSTRAHWNTVGNLIDSALMLHQEGHSPMARRAIALAVDLEGRFGGVPEHFWSQPARDLRPAGAPTLSPITAPEDTLAPIPDGPLAAVASSAPVVEAATQPVVTEPHP